MNRRLWFMPTAALSAAVLVAACGATSTAPTGAASTPASAASAAATGTTATATTVAPPPAGTPSATSAGVSPTPHPLPSTTESPAASIGVDGCVPECLPQNGVAPGPLGAGRYTTRFFFARALSITFDAGWTALYDATNELHFEHPSPADWHLFVWLDPYPVQHLKRVQGIARTPAALMAWWQTDPALITTPGPTATIGAGLSAVTMDLQVSDAATKEAPDCPDLCTNYIGFENGPDAAGLVRGEKARIYLAPVTYGGQSHLLGVTVEVVDGASFEQVLPAAQKLIDTIRMPVAPVAASPAVLPGGRLAYGRFGPAGVSLFTNNPAGTDEQALLSQNNEGPRWSPNGQRLSATAESPQGSIFFGLVNPNGSDFVRFNSPEPTLQLACGSWATDGLRLACEGWDDSNPARNGIYTVRASDGGDLTRLTTNPSGGHDFPGDYSPDGRQIAFIRINPADEEHDTLMVVNVDGRGERAMTSQKVGLACRWSPDGKAILTEADGSLLLVPVDGGTPTPITIPADSPVIATRPGWSPDGTWIVFSRVSSAGEDIYVMQADGTNLHQVTNTPGQNEEFADWG